jgi:peptide/nickel transport system substrate-binding protein
MNGGGSRRSGRARFWLPSIRLRAASATWWSIRLGIGENIDTLDPHQTTIITAVAIHNNIYNGLLKITYDGQTVDFVPDLAHRWEIVGDRTHVFHLHKEVTFHNGKPLTAAVEKWNLERVKHAKQSPMHAWKLKLLESIEIPDDHVIKLTFAKPFPFLRVALTGSTGRPGTIVSLKAVEQWGKDYGRHPVGTSAFTCLALHKPTVGSRG